MFHDEARAGFLGCPASPLLEALRAARSPMAIVMPPEAGGRLMFVNQAFAGLLGRSERELKDSRLQELATDDAEVREIERHLADVGNSRVATLRLALMGSSGIRTPASLSLAAVKGALGETFCVMCSLIAFDEGACRLEKEDADSLARIAELASELLAQESGPACPPTE